MNITTWYRYASFEQQVSLYQSEGWTLDIYSGLKRFSFGMIRRYVYWSVLLVSCDLNKAGSARETITFSRHAMHRSASLMPSNHIPKSRRRINERDYKNFHICLTASYSFDYNRNRRKIIAHWYFSSYSSVISGEQHAHALVQLIEWNMKQKDGAVCPSLTWDSRIKICSLWFSLNKRSSSEWG